QPGGPSLSGAMPALLRRIGTDRPVRLAEPVRRLTAGAVAVDSFWTGSPAGRGSSPLPRAIAEATGPTTMAVAVHGREPPGAPRRAQARRAIRFRGEQPTRRPSGAGVEAARPPIGGLGGNGGAAIDPARLGGRGAPRCGCGLPWPRPGGFCRRSPSGPPVLALSGPYGREAQPPPAGESTWGHRPPGRATDHPRS